MDPCCRLQEMHKSPTHVHNAILLDGDTLDEFYTRACDSPERTFTSRVALGPDRTT